MDGQGEDGRSGTTSGEGLDTALRIALTLLIVAGAFAAVSHAFSVVFQ